MRKFLMLFLATVAMAASAKGPRTAEYKVEWLNETPAGNIVGAFIPDASGYTEMLCATTRADFDRTGTIQCKEAIRTPEPEELKSAPKKQAHTF